MLYLTASRPDIIFSICMCSRYQSNPKKSHLNAVKKFFKYLKSTQNLEFWFLKQSSMDLIGYSDANFVEYKLNRKSTSRTCQFLGVNLISWFIKKQNSVALSMAEAEYIAVRSCYAQILWIKQ